MSRMTPGPQSPPASQARPHSRRRKRPRGHLAPRHAVLLLLALGAGGCGPVATEASKRNARPWNPRLAGLFDDQNDLCTPWIDSQEIWAVNERHLLAQRTSEADIIAVGQVRATIRTDAFDESKQASLQVDLETLLRGSLADLPEGNRRILLPVSSEQQTRITTRIIGRRAVLFLRWLPGTTPPFRWHLTCATTGVTDRVKTLYEARKKRQAPP